MRIRGGSTTPGIPLVVTLTARGPSLYLRKVLHYREFITLLEQNIIIDIFQDIPLVFMAAILKIGFQIQLGT